MNDFYERPTYRPSYLEDEDSVQRDEERAREIPPAVVVTDTEPEEVAEVKWDGLWLKLKYGIIDEDTYWKRRVSDDRQSIQESS